MDYPSTSCSFAQECRGLGNEIANKEEESLSYIEITAWLASAYDFYARVVKRVVFSNLSQQGHNKNRPNVPTMQ